MLFGFVRSSGLDQEQAQGKQQPGLAGVPLQAGLEQLDGLLHLVVPAQFLRLLLEFGNGLGYGRSSTQRQNDSGNGRQQEVAMMAHETPALSAGRWIQWSLDLV